MSQTELPGAALAGFGPRLDAHIAMLAGVFRLSRDDVRRIVVEVFGVPASKGSIDNAIMRISAVLADPWAELRHAVQRAEVVHADETGWRLQGAQQWLWVAASALVVACYRIDPSRSQAAAKELLGEDFGGFVVTDRYAGYHFLEVMQQQLCWCHYPDLRVMPMWGLTAGPRARAARQAGREGGALRATARIGGPAGPPMRQTSTYRNQPTAWGQFKRPLRGQCRWPFSPLGYHSRRHS